MRGKRAGHDRQAAIDCRYSRPSPVHV
jgi:hypothetical protein